MDGYSELNVKPSLGFTLPSAGVTPAPAVRRRENLRSASFRDYAMEQPARDNGARP